MALRIALARPLGFYMAKVYLGRPTLIDRVVGPLGRSLYRLARVRADREMTWQVYGVARVLFNLLGCLALWALQTAQGLLPLNPAHLPSVTAGLALNTAISFTTNTNWQSYSGETTMSILTHSWRCCYSLSRELAATPATEDIASAAARHVADALPAPATVLLPRFDGRLVPLSGRQAAFTLTPRDEAVARWVLEHGRMAGMGTDTLPGAGALFIPVAGTRGPVAVLGVRPSGPEPPSPDSVHLLEALASQTAAALERARLAEEAQSARVTAETEKLRSTLLSSVSHDLRTPLASITGSASTLLDPGADDYLTKPFGIGELLARIRVALRHAARGDRGAGDPEVAVGDLRIDMAGRQVFARGAEVRLTPIEYSLLAALARNAGRVVTQRQLLKEVWGPGAVEQTHYLRVHMAHLRRKIESEPARPRYLITEPGVGDRLRSE